jgi:D-alanyl-D-alanine dipeptidase
VVAALALSQRGHAETTKVEAKQSADTKPNAVPKPHSVEPVSVTPVVTKASANGAPIAAEARELIVVRSANWQSSTGTLTRFERDAGSAPWHAVGEAVAINLGRHGMAWGRGLHSSPANGPVKRERDGKSPAGVFALSYAFGAAPELPDGSKPFPYLQVKKGVACVEETRSKFYNRIVDASADKSWERRSEMLRKDGLFRWGVVVEQNAPDTVAGSGSCVFLHIWRGPKQPTSGCTSLAPDRLEEILRWLQADKHPLLVQLPDPVYEELHESWKLPD